MGTSDGLKDLAYISLAENYPRNEGERTSLSSRNTMKQEEQPYR